MNEDGSRSHAAERFGVEELPGQKEGMEAICTGE